MEQLYQDPKDEMKKTIINLTRQLRSSLDQVEMRDEPAKERAFSCLEKLFREIGLYNQAFSGQRIYDPDMRWYFIEFREQLRLVDPLRTNRLETNLRGVIERFAILNTLELRASEWLDMLSGHYRGPSAELLEVREKHAQIKAWLKLYQKYKDSETFKDRYRVAEVELSKLSE